MTIADNNLAEALKLLPEAQRQAIEEALRGAKTDESAAVMRWIKRRLKRRVRARRKPR